MLSEPVNAGLFCGSLLRCSGGSFLLRSLLGSGGRGLLGSFGLDAAGSDGRLDGVGREDAQQADDDCQAPGSFLYEVGGLAVAHKLVAFGIVRGQACAFRFLYQNGAYKQYAGQNYQYCKEYVHYFVLLVVVLLYYYQFFQKPNLVCKVSAFFRIFQIQS